MWMFAGRTGEVDVRVELERLDHVHDLDQRDPRVRRRRRDDLQATVRPVDRFAGHGLEVRQVLQGHGPALGGHARDEGLGRLALVEAVAAVVGDPLQDLRQLRLDQQIALHLGKPVGQEDLREFRTPGQAFHGVQDQAGQGGVYP